MAQAKVLVVGAGPTGLVLALWLAKSGIPVRITDKADAPGTTSRAILFQARNLEFYHQLGIARAAVERGIEFTAANLWTGGKHVARVSFAELGRGISPYPYILILPQDQQEQLLGEQLEREGVRVERKTELVAFEQTEDGVGARLKHENGDSEVCDVEYLVGCDGAHSFVRQRLGIGFPGGTYDDLYYVADIDAEGRIADGEMHGALDNAEFLAIFPMKGRGHVRLVGQVDPAEAAAKTSWENVSRTVMAHLPMKVERVQWFSTYHVGHRVAAAFRSKRVFLAGDAAHIHSPVGGQGMNTGIGDAVNLAWKLGSVLQGRASAAVLDSYEPERMAFARRLVATTDRAFQFVSARGSLAKDVRLTVVPAILPCVFEFRAARALLFRTISQTSVRYRQSPLSSGRAGNVFGGDRLPWIFNPGNAPSASDNFGPLISRDWQVHVYGEVPADLQAFCDTRRLDLHAFPWSSSMRAVGIRENASYLVRPDGYVGLANETADVAVLEGYLDAHQIRLV